MGEEQVIREILEKMREKGITLENLSFNSGFKITVNDLDIVFSYSGKYATIFYEGESKYVSLLEGLAKEVVTLLSEEDWKAGQKVTNSVLVRTLVSTKGNKFFLMDSLFHLLDSESFTKEELQEKGWKLIK